MPECCSKINTLVQLLANSPDVDSISCFPLDVSGSTSMHIGRPPKRLIQQVMQAQMTGLILGVLVQLALADSYSLAHHIYDVEGLQLLHDIAMARTQHAHPELQDAIEVKQLRPDVHKKLCQVYRLLPLAISSIYEVTFSRETYSAQVAANASHAADASHRQVALQLQDSLHRLEHPALLDAADASAGRQAEANHTLRHVVLKVKSAEPQSGYMCELQYAWWSAVGGYNERQAGNCLFWLFEEPPANHGSRSSIHTETVSSGHLHHCGEPFDHDAAPSAPYAGDMYHQEQGVHLTSSVSGTSGATRANAEDMRNSRRAARPAAQPHHTAIVHRRIGWPVVLFGLATFAIGLLVGSYPTRHSGTGGSTKISHMLPNTARNLEEQHKQNRRRNRHRAPRDREWMYTWEWPTSE